MLHEAIIFYCEDVKVPEIKFLALLSLKAKVEMKIDFNSEGTPDTKVAKIGNAIILTPHLLRAITQVKVSFPDEAYVAALQAEKSRDTIAKDYKDDNDNDEEDSNKEEEDAPEGDTGNNDAASTQVATRKRADNKAITSQVGTNVCIIKPLLKTLWLCGQQGSRKENPVAINSGAMPTQYQDMCLWSEDLHSQFISCKTGQTPSLGAAAASLIMTLDKLIDKLKDRSTKIVAITIDGTKESKAGFD